MSLLSTTLRLGGRRATFLVSSIQSIAEHDDASCVITQGGIKTAIDIPYDEAIEKWRLALIKPGDAPP